MTLKKTHRFKVISGQMRPPSRFEFVRTEWLTGAKTCTTQPCFWWRRLAKRDPGAAKTSAHEEHSNSDNSALLTTPGTGTQTRAKLRKMTTKIYKSHSARVSEQPSDVFGGLSSIQFRRHENGRSSRSQISSIPECFASATVLSVFLPVV